MEWYVCQGWERNSIGNASSTYILSPALFHLPRFTKTCTSKKADRILSRPSRAERLTPGKKTVPLEGLHGLKLFHRMQGVLCWCGCIGAGLGQFHWIGLPRLTVFVADIFTDNYLNHLTFVFWGYFVLNNCSSTKSVKIRRQKDNRGTEVKERH